jgi:hypothetical protein
VLGLAVAQNALAADTININRFSKTVNGNSGVAGTGVTVNLLRNTTDANGVTVRQQVDTFPTTADGTGAWSGSFTKHAFAVENDEIEVVYAGAGAPPKVTIGAGNLLPSATVSPAHVVNAPPNAIDGHLGISSDGMKLKDYSGGLTFSATVNGVAAPAPVGDTITFAAPVTNADTVRVSATFTDGTTTVTLTDSAPLVNIVPADQTAPFNTSMAQPGCVFYLVTREVVCFKLKPASPTTPASYTLIQLRGGATVSSQTLTVPARNAATGQIPTLAASMPFAGVLAGDQFQLKFGAPASGHLLTTLTVNPLTIAVNTPFSDLNSGSNTTVTGSCTPGVFFNDEGFNLCPPDGTIPATQNLGYASSSLDYLNSTFGPPGDLDDTGTGATVVDPPAIAFRAPLSQESISTPFIAFALVRYNDPAALVAAQNSGAATGPSPIAASTMSSAPATFSYAPFGSSSFTLVGNANQPGGLLVPALPKGPYVGRFTVADSRGDTNTSESSFVAQAAPPSGPAPANCQAKTSSGKATVAAAKRKGKGKKKRKAKPKSSMVTITLSCSSTSSGRLAVWLERGSSVLADGSGVVSHGVARIVLQGKFPRGTYRLIELIDAGGKATESKQTLTLKR